MASTWFITLSVAAATTCLSCSDKSAQPTSGGSAVHRVINTVKARVLSSWSVTAEAPPSAPPNAEGQTPARPDQTRAPAPGQLSRVTVTTVAKGLREPWGVEALADGRFVVTEKAGKLRVVTADGQILPELAGVPAVDSYDQAGLLDVAVTDQQADQLTLCVTYAQAREHGKNRTAAACGRAHGHKNLELSDMRVVFRQEPAWDSSLHFGSRLVFAPGDLMYITTGERSLPQTRGFSQDVTKTLGKVIRLQRDGSAPPDNPFAKRGGAAAQVYSYGHRNIQAAGLDAQARLWVIEHGPRGGDELNLVKAGANYGWPIITYGEDYSGEPIGKGITQQPGMEQPVYYWDPVIAPCGMLFYSGELFAAWKNDILVGGLVAQALVHLHMKDDRVVSEERIPIGARVRDVTQGPDGAVYVITDEVKGRLLRLTPEPSAVAPT